MYYFRLHILNIALATLCTFTGGIDSSESNSSWTTEDILNVLYYQEGIIKDIYIDFYYEETIKAENETVTRKSANVTYAGSQNLFKTRKQVLDENGDGEISSDWEFSADGERKYFCDRGAFYGTVEKSLPEQAAIKQSWGSYYLTCVYWMPREKGRRGKECNLIGALEEDKNIKVAEELFEGRKTVVLIRPDYCKIYLDPALNFAVLASEATGSLTFKVRNSNFVEVTEGIWMPMQTERTYRNDSDWITRKTKVNKLEINNKFTEEDFRIKFEPGIRAYDVDLDMYITPSPANMDSVYLDGLVEIAKQRDHIDVHYDNKPANQSTVIDNNNTILKTSTSTPTPSILVETEMTDSRCLIQQVVTFVCLGLTAVLLLAFWVIRYRKKMLNIS